MAIKVLLADDHHILRQGVKSLLENEIGIKVVGEARDGREAMRLVQELEPDVVVMDVSMPNMNGIEATRMIHESDPDVKVIALSVHTDDQFVTGMLMAGASGYLLKDCVPEELVKAIEMVSNGLTYLSAPIAKSVLQQYKSLKSSEIHSKLSMLTAREREVLQLIAESKTMKQISEKLFISEKTVATHKQHIMDKLNLDSVSELVKFAIREGLIAL